MIKRRICSGSEVCGKCGVENNSGYTWKRSRAGFPDLPLLCASCSKALSRDIKGFVKKWLKKKD